MTVHFIGAGPGAADLITLRGRDLIARHAALGGDLTRIAIARAEPVGGKTGWHPAMPITQWSFVNR